MSLVYLLVLASMMAGIFSLGWMRLAHRFNLFDVPNDRSSHRIPIPKGGGIGFALAYLLYILYLAKAGVLPGEWLYLSALSLVLLVLGLLDDIMELGIPARLSLQFLATAGALALLPLLPAVPWPFNGTFWFLPAGLCLLLAWVWFINLYNFMDGIDALACSEAIYAALALGWMANMAGSTALGFMCLALAASLCGFLLFNVSPARLFMGDAGSNFLGYTLGLLGLLALLNGVATPWTLLILFGVFVVDSSITLLRRMATRQVWYHGHRSHAYQQAAMRYESHSKVVLGITCINVCWLLPLAWLSVLYAEAGWILMVTAWLPLLGLQFYYQKGEFATMGHQR
jgi:Fuc2NAc and GlcNAc transferase